MLRALGREDELAHSSIRFTIGRFTTQEEIDYVLGKVRDQVERLREARATGAEMLVTACVKCQIHFKCAQDDPLLRDQIGIPGRDWATVVAERL